MIVQEENKKSLKKNTRKRNSKKIKKKIKQRIAELVAEEKAILEELRKKFPPAPPELSENIWFSYCELMQVGKIKDPLLSYWDGKPILSFSI